MAKDVINSFFGGIFFFWVIYKHPPATSPSIPFLWADEVPFEQELIGIILTN